MLWAWALFGEPLTWAMATGLAVTLGGVALVATGRIGAPAAAE
jgi:drug/metabolite transporter (DMT)-like permease